MKAVAISAFKAFPQLTDLPEPTVKEGTVKIKLAAAGLNPFDWKLIDGILQDSMPHTFPMIIGTDGAGTIVETGEGVTRFKTGDKIYGQMIHSPIGEGSYAEYVVVPETAAISAAPDNISLEEAAGAPTAGMTAVQLLDRSNLQAGETLLLIGATGGVGSFVIQVAKARGIRVIGTVSSKAAAERITALGAAETIDYTKAPIEEQFPGGADAIIDLVSNKSAFEKLLSLVKRDGVILTTQFVADPQTIKDRNLNGGNFETKGTAESLEVLKGLIDSGAVNIPIDQQVNLAQAGAAIAQSREGKSKGKTIILIS